MLKPVSPDIAALKLADERLRWLSAWTIHHANHIRDSADGLKVGGHQASCASMTAIMAALYFHALGPNDRVAVKPHAGPVLHAIHYLLCSQSLEQLQNFRGFGGMQSYPSRTKDRIPVDFSTGSVGLGVAITAFASLVQDYLTAHGLMAEAERGRFVALIGDAELDEGNIYECLIEAYKHDIRNCWWIVDYNRQSLDATSADRMFERFDEIFRSCGWRTIELRYGKKLAAALKANPVIADWLDTLPNADHSALLYQGGAAWRARIDKDLGKKAAAFLKAHDDEALAGLMSDLGGHCMETLVEAFDAAQDDVPTLFVAWTVKGFGLPFAGHKDNHAGLMNPTQMAALRQAMGVQEGEEWEPLAGVGANARPGLEALIERSKVARDKRQRAFGSVEIPAIPAPAGDEQSTQAAFGRILLDLAKSGHPLADRIVTTSPDVTVSTNLGAWVNQRGLYKRKEMVDVFATQKIASAQKWSASNQGQHIELGIAESNLFLMLAAAGLAGDLFGQRLFPIGTLYDPFIARGLDSLNYACYQDARFLLVATPSGITLGPEGGAHQSINPPLIALGQPGLRHYEPAFADELAAMMQEAFRLIDDPQGESTYLRLSTRSLQQVERAEDNWKAAALAGGYWLREPGPNAEAAIVAMGAVMPEALAAYDELSADIPGLGLLAITSPDLTVSTNLGAWVNQRGLYKRKEMADVFATQKITSAQKWSASNQGQHIELGIAESNLFLMLAAAGLAGDLFGQRLFPIGTLYDPFIARGLDSLNYACYQDARFLLVATPSGITLGPEGGAHQSINPPLIALGQPGLRHYEPAFADELAAMMQEAFRLIDDPQGESTYLRLSTRSLQQVERADDDWRAGALAGAYWLREPGPNAEAAIVAMGAVMPEALAAQEELSADIPGLGLLAVTSPDLLHRGWSAAQAARWAGKRNPSHIETLLAKLAPDAGLVTLADAAPASLSWLGGVLGQRVAPLGVDRFGQTGSLNDLYAAYRLDGAAITEAIAEVLLTA